MQIRKSTSVLLVFGVLAMAASAIALFGSAEVIKVRAVEDVPLFDPSSLAGQIGDQPKLVGLLKSGDELEVLECNPRKSDINVHATYQGKVVAVGEWKAKVRLIRVPAHRWQQGAITSCLGFFESISTTGQ